MTGRRGACRSTIIVRIGVALSGCDIGGVAAYDVLRELQRQGFGVGMISTCGMPSVTALLFAAGYGEEDGDRHTEKFLRTAREIDIDMAVAEFSAEVPLDRDGDKTPAVVSSVNVADGNICAFTGECEKKGERLRAYPLCDAYDALSATISPVEGLASYQYDGSQLCDFSVWYGVPVYPLKLAAVDRVLSVAFLPCAPRTPYEALVKQKIEASAHLADVHIPIAFAGPLTAGEYAARAIGQVREHAEEIFNRLLF